MGPFLSSFSAASWAQPIIRPQGLWKLVETSRLGSPTHHPALGSILYQDLVTSSDGDFTSSKAKNLQTGLT